MRIACDQTEEGMPSPPGWEFTCKCVRQFDESSRWPRCCAGAVVDDLGRVCMHPAGLNGASIHHAPGKNGKAKSGSLPYTATVTHDMVVRCQVGLTRKQHINTETQNVMKTIPVIEWDKWVTKALCRQYDTLLAAPLRGASEPAADEKANPAEDSDSPATQTRTLQHRDSSASESDSASDSDSPARPKRFRP